MGQYDTYTSNYKEGKIVVSGVGNNGLATIIKLMENLRATEIVGLVRKKEDPAQREKYMDQKQALLRVNEEAHIIHKHPKTTITDNLEDTAHAQVWINFQGLNLAKLEKVDPDYSRKAEELGLHRRDMLLGANIPLLVNDFYNAIKYAPNCFYMAEINPTDVMTYVAQKLAIKNDIPIGKVISTGNMVDVFRFAKLLSKRFNTTMVGASYRIIGEHGELAIPVKNCMTVGTGVTAQEFVQTIINGQNILDQTYIDVKNEAKWIREHTGKTPSVGPGAVAAELASYMINHRTTILPISHYIESDDNYRQSDGTPIKDIALTIPASVSRKGINYGDPLMPDPNLSNGEQKEFYNTVNHLTIMNKYADRILKEKGLIRKIT